MAETLSRLSKELSLTPVNVLKVRELCRENPGLVDQVEKRAQIWGLLLLGEVNVNEDFFINPPGKACSEQHVLEADVKRTRSEMDVFRSDEWRVSVMNILQSFCINHEVQYKQGMNEILAPFLFVHQPPKGSLLPYRLFEAFLYRYLERYFCQDDSAFLFKAFRLFHILLMYHDPQLAWHLKEQEFPPELYAPQWFMTLYSRGLPMPLVLRLWDMLISVDDPAFTFFIGLCLLRRRREAFLLTGVDGIPEVIAKMHQLQDETEIDGLGTEALELYQATPRCFIRSLRLCCVSTPELAPLPWGVLPTAVKSQDKSRQPQMGTDKVWAVREQAMAEQAARSCVMLSAQELVGLLSPRAVDVTAAVHSPGGLMARDRTQIVLIDVRSREELNNSGGGMLPKAVQLDPEFLCDSQALDSWVQHFDGTRGCSICIIDMPPAQLSGFALWRRILLGEGDGLPHTISYGKGQPVGKGDKASGGSQRRDTDSEYSVAESAAEQDDAVRHAVQLAIALQVNGFPKVSVLEGGFPALVTQLSSSRGGVEPVIINHDSIKWTEYLRVTGRQQSASAEPSKSSDKLPKSDGKGGDDPDVEDSMVQVEQLSIAFRVAQRSGHRHMADVIRGKLSKLGVTVAPSDSSLSSNAQDEPPPPPLPLPSASLV